MRLTSSLVALLVSSFALAENYRTPGTYSETIAEDTDGDGITDRATTTRKWGEGVIATIKDIFQPDNRLSITRIYDLGGRMTHKIARRYQRCVKDIYFAHDEEAKPDITLWMKPTEEEVVSLRKDEDFNCDGQVDKRTIFRDNKPYQIINYRYQEGELVGSVERTNIDGDGNFEDSQEFTYEVQRSLEEITFRKFFEGRLVEETMRFFSDGEYKGSLIFQYDSEGRKTTFQADWDRDTLPDLVRRGDGPLEEIER